MNKLKQEDFALSMKIILVNEGIKKGLFLISMVLEECFSVVDTILQALYFPTYTSFLSFYSYLFSICFRSDKKIWSFERRMAFFEKNSSL